MFLYEAFENILFENIEWIFFISISGFEKIEFEWIVFPKRVEIVE